MEQTKISLEMKFGQVCERLGKPEIKATDQSKPVGSAGNKVSVSDF